MRFFQFMREEVPATAVVEFLNDAVDPDVPLSDLQQEGVEIDQQFRDALTQALSDGADPADVDGLEAAVNAVLNPPPPTKAEPIWAKWRKAETTPPPVTTPPKTTAAAPRAAATPPVSEDIRRWDPDDVEVSLFTLAQSLFVKHGLRHFEITTSQTRRWVDEQKKRIFASDEPVFWEDVVKEGDNRYEAIAARLRVRSEIVGALAGRRLSQVLLDGVVTTRQRADSFPFSISEYVEAAYALEQQGHAPDQIVSALKMGIALHDLDRGCRAILAVPLSATAPAPRQPSQPSPPIGKAKAGAGFKARWNRK